MSPPPTGPSQGDLGGRRAAPPLLAAIVLAAAAVWPALLAGELLVGRDLLPQFYPRMELIGAALAEGTVPRWNPWAGHGAPWFGLRTGGVLYPGHVLFALLPSWLAMGAYVALHFALATEGARRLAAHDRPGPSAAFCGITYGLGGFLVSQYWALPYLVSGAWLPWALLGALRVAATPARGAALVALSIGMQLLDGEPQGALATSIAAVVLAGVRARARGETMLRAATTATLAVGLGAAVAAPQVLSMLLELRGVDRLQEHHHFDARWGFAPAGLLVDAVAPGALGQHAFHEGAYWGLPLWKGELPWCGLGVGTLGAAAVVTALLSSRSLRPIERTGVVLAVAGVLLAASPVTQALHLRFPAKWLVLTALGLALLAGAGASSWTHRRGGRAAPLVLVSLLVIGGLGATDAGASALARVVVDVELWPAARRATTAAFGRTAVMAALALVAWRVADRAGASGGRRLGVALLLGAASLDLLVSARAAARTTSIDMLARPPLVDVLAAQAARPAGAPLRYDGAGLNFDHLAPVVPGLFPEEARELMHQRVLLPNNGYRFGVRMIAPFEAVQDGLRGELFKSPRFERLPAPLRLARLDVDMFPIERATLESLPPGDRERLRVLGALTGSGELLLARNLACPDWASCVGVARVVDSVGDAVDALLDPRLDSRTEVVLGPEGAPAALEPTAPHATVTIRRLAPELVELEVEAAADCWLVLRDAFDPAWRATVDGEETVVARADLLYRAVRLEAGRRVVRFSFEPAWWTPGLVLMGCGIVVLSALWALERRPSARSRIRLTTVHPPCTPRVD